MLPFHARNLNTTVAVRWKPTNSDPQSGTSLACCGQDTATMRGSADARRKVGARVAKCCGLRASAASTNFTQVVAGRSLGKAAKASKRPWAHLRGQL